MIGDYFIIRSFMFCTSEQILLEYQNLGVQGMLYIRAGWYMCTGCWYGKKHMEDLVVDGNYVNI